jgi:hypothetical protein
MVTNWPKVSIWPDSTSDSYYGLQFVCACGKVSGFQCWLWGILSSRTLGCYYLVVHWSFGETSFNLHEFLTDCTVMYQKSSCVCVSYSQWLKRTHDGVAVQIFLSQLPSWLGNFKELFCSWLHCQ